MMNKWRHTPWILTTVFAFVLSAPLPAQTFPTTDPVLRRIWTLGMDSSHTYPLAQALMDSIGPRLTGSPEYAAAVDWALSRYETWDIKAHSEKLLAFRTWTRGTTHVDLIAPRVRTLEAVLQPYSSGTGGRPVEGDVVLPPADSSASSLQAVKGKFVLLGAPDPSCRPSEDWQRWVAPGSQPPKLRPATEALWGARKSVTTSALETAGAVGLLTSSWSGGWGTSKVQFVARTKLPTVLLSCEDYGLLARLAEHRQGPRLRVAAQTESGGEAPIVNVIAELKGAEKPAEYVMISEHLDSWDGGTGAQDNGTGAVIVLEAMRILKAAYPRPKRTILGWLWGGDEVGNPVGGSGYLKAHPEVMRGVQAIFYQDAGTGRIVELEGDARVDSWLSRLPTVLTAGVKRRVTDRIIKPSPIDWNHKTYTYHTNRDTFDKLVFDDLKKNVTLTAMLMYLASEEATTLPPYAP